MSKAKINFPKIFRERFNKMLGKNEAKIFFEYCSKPLRRSIRINTLKISREECIEILESKGWELENIPWYENAFYVKINRESGDEVDNKKANEEEKLGNELEHFLGYYYIQESASMLPPLAMDPGKDDFVLDLTASPGSKTSMIAQMMGNKGCIVANDLRLDRIKILRFNLDRLGVLNTVVTRMHGGKFIKFRERFDKVLLDAPCSSEGEIRRNWKTLSKWSIKFIESLSKLQKKLIDAAIIAARKKGTIIYSTCTLAPEENEEVVNHAIKKFNVGVERIDINGLKAREGIRAWNEKEYSKEVKKCLRIYPQDNDTQAFFLAKLIKD